MLKDKARNCECKTFCPRRESICIAANLPVRFHSPVPWRSFAKYWLPVLVWMTLIFLLSTDLGSTRQTSRFIGPVLRFFWPDVSEEQIRGVQFAVRKTGHVVGYAILAALLWRARRGDARGWNAAHARFAWLAAAFYAGTDEIHQSMVPTRMGSVWDVLLDSFGAGVGLALIWWIGRRRRLW